MKKERKNIQKNKQKTKTNSEMDGRWMDDTKLLTLDQGGRYIFDYTREDSNLKVLHLKHSKWCTS